LWPTPGRWRGRLDLPSLTRGVLCRIKHLNKVLVVSDTSCATYQPYLTMNI
jgi:hypothetical protein